MSEIDYLQEIYNLLPLIVGVFIVIVIVVGSVLNYLNGRKIEEVVNEGLTKLENEQRVQDGVMLLLSRVPQEFREVAIAILNVGDIASDFSATDFDDRTIALFKRWIMEYEATLPEEPTE